MSDWIDTLLLGGYDIFKFLELIGNTLFYLKIFENKREVQR